MGVRSSYCFCYHAAIAAGRWGGGGGGYHVSVISMLAQVILAPILSVLHIAERS